MRIRNKPGFEIPLQCIPTNSLGLPADARRWNVISRLIAQNGYRRGAELGLLEGRTMAFLLERHPGLWMIGVDLWAPQPENDGPEDYIGWDHVGHEKTCRDRMARFGSRAVVVRADTAAAAAYVDDRSLGFVFIDADHGEAAVRRDIEAWLPEVAPGGMMIGHDINWPSVRAAVDDLLPDYSIGWDVTWWSKVQ